jgi:hypothetical protein
MPLPLLAKAKNGQKHSYAPPKKFLPPKRWAACNKVHVFFLLGRVGVLDFVVLIVFSWSFHCVSIKFPLSSQHVPNSSSLYPIFFVINSTLENLYIQPKRGGYHISIFWDCLKLGYFFGFLMSQRKMPITLKKNFEGSHN